MAVCNLFSELNKPTGNFLMFSQYVEDLTKGMVQNESYRVNPSHFLVCNIDYSRINIPNKQNLNTAIPEFFQNYFENSCAFLRDYTDPETSTKFEWDSNISSNLFWQTLYRNKFITHTQGIIPEIKYVGEVDIQSYDEHAGMGYSEIYCHIPSDTKEYEYSIKLIDNSDNSIVNTSHTLCGYDDINIDDYSKNYFFESPFIYESCKELETNKYTFNTIIVLYDIYVKTNTEWFKITTDIPMGIYFTGNFIETKISQPVTKFVSTPIISGNGTSYGLRICTRFSVTPNNSNINIENFEVSDNYAAFCEAMSGMIECQDEMLNIVSGIADQTQNYKDLYSIFKNSRTNVPYIKTINDENYWFVNGKLISTAAGGSGSGGCDCEPYPDKDIDDNFPDGGDIPTPDPGGGCECQAYTIDEIKDIFPGGIEPQPPMPEPTGCDCEGLSQQDIQDVTGL